MVKVNVISGFLGAGKTTLIKKLLSEALKGQKVILLENEYGEIGIDGGFMKDSGIQVTELNSGCICCTLAGDFQKAIDELIDTYHPERILLEPSGVGKLSDIRRVVEKAKERHDIELTGCCLLYTSRAAGRDRVAAQVRQVPRPAAAAHQRPAAQGDEPPGRQSDDQAASLRVQAAGHYRAHDDDRGIPGRDRGGI